MIPISRLVGRSSIDALSHICALFCWETARVGAVLRRLGGDNKKHKLKADAWTRCQLDLHRSNWTYISISLSCALTRANTIVIVFGLAIVATLTL